MNQLHTGVTLLLLSAAFLFAADDPDWPSAHPSGPPTDPTYSIPSTGSLLPVILAKKQVGDWRDNSRAACVWFLWKTRDGKVGLSQRTQLAHRIFTKLKHARNKHDLAILASYLGPLGAREEIRELLRQINLLDCCYGPALVGGLAECGTKADIPFLITIIGKESESSGGMTHEALVRVAGVNPLPNDKWPYDRQNLKRVWEEWWKTAAHQ